MKFRAILLSALLALAAAKAEGQIACGATVTADTTLAADMFCPSHAIAFTVKGPAKVDMAGHRLIGCAVDGIGIDVIGTGATLKNGAVVDCDTGVRVRGTGKHRVENMVVLKAYYGYDVRSADNTVVRTAAIGSGYIVSGENGAADDNTLTDNVSVRGDWGFLIESNDGSYDRNISSHAGEIGFEVVGSWNSLRYNISRDSHFYGFGIDGAVNRFERNLSYGDEEGAFKMVNPTTSTGNRMLRNIAIGSAGYGFELGAGTVFMNNTAVDNGDQGIRANYPGTSIIESAAIGQSIGIFAKEKVLVRRSRALANSAGIMAGSGTDVSITKNFAIGNNIDLVDNNNCAGHTWEGNIFSTANPSCQ